MSLHAQFVYTYIDLEASKLYVYYTYTNCVILNTYIRVIGKKKISIYNFIAFIDIECNLHSYAPYVMNLLTE